MPADGDVFDFEVYPIYVWTGNQMPVEELGHLAERYGAWARRLVRDRTAEIARRYAPHRANDLERKLNEWFAGKNWTCHGEGAVFRLGVHLRVRPDQRVRDQLRPYWEQRIKMECNHELDRLRANLVDRLTEEWSTVLQKLQQNPSMAHAARLTEEQFATVLGQFTAERKESVRDILALLQEALRKHDLLGLGPSEYTEAWDAALRAFQKEYGLQTRPDELSMSQHDLCLLPPMKVCVGDWRSSSCSLAAGPACRLGLCRQHRWQRVALAHPA